MDPNTWTIEYVLENTKSCEEYMEKFENCAKLPLLNNIGNYAVKDLTLVRFRGMIQDMLDPEFYLETYTLASGSTTRLQNGKYRDTIVYKNEQERLDSESSENVHGERRSMFVLSVPGVNSWVSEVERELYSAHHENNIAESVQGGSTSKRSFEDDNDMDVDEHVNISFDPTDPVKRLKATGNPKDSAKEAAKISNGILSADYLLNSPIQDRPSKACIVKIYDNFDKYKLNTVVDVIGFVSMDPVLDGSQDKLPEFEGIDVEEHISSNPPPSLIPRIHAIKVSELQHINPLIDAEPSINWDSNIAGICSDLHKTLSQCLFGDEVAAHYLFCHLLSNIYARIDVENLGRCALNLSHLPAEVVATDYIQQLYEIIEMLVPASHYFPLTLENLNTTQFNPKKDFKTNRLTSGLLQLAPQTHLVVDETRMATGQLQASGVAAIGSMSQLITTQVVKFDFQFYQLDFEADVPVLVISEGKSILPSDFHCPLKPSEPEAVRIIAETLIAAKQFIRKRSRDFRCLLTMQKKQNFTLGAGVQNAVQNDLVELRRDFNMKPDDFHLFLNLSRLVGKSLGKKETDAETWELVKSLEMERRSRVDALPQRKSAQTIEA